MRDNWRYLLQPDISYLFLRQITVNRPFKLGDKRATSVPVQKQISFVETDNNSSMVLIFTDIFIAINNSSPLIFN